MGSQRSKSFVFNDINTSDVTVYLRNNKGKPELFHSHFSVLKGKSIYFADKLSALNCDAFIDIYCSNSNYEHHVNLLRCLYLSEESLLESSNSVHSVVGVLQLASGYNCKKITESCVQYLEAIPWEDKEEELIMKVVSKLGPVAMPILARVQSVDFSATKNVFHSAICFATSVVSPSPPFGDELKTSAQE
ncbi:hypothetical protein CTI12_AA505370 [Artemisia annua]|uniref:BTB domain-containing protein n=1 Tax=Artemisia annua TaxID=35608 RepID=A0A2U1LCN0_ARTAN|nr:hypothetical protein CTI12_AA505370 [Artemisia annua]